MKRTLSHPADPENPEKCSTKCSTNTSVKCILPVHSESIPRKSRNNKYANGANISIKGIDYADTEWYKRTKESPEDLKVWKQEYQGSFEGKE